MSSSIKCVVFCDDGSLNKIKREKWIKIISWKTIENSNLLINFGSFYLGLFLICFGHFQRPGIRNNGSVPCNAMTGNLLRYIRDLSALKARPELTTDMQEMFALNLDYQISFINSSFRLESAAIGQIICGH